MLVWPITMSLRVIFYPAHMVMFLIVNVIGSNIKVAKYLEKDQTIAYKMPRVYFFTPFLKRADQSWNDKSDPPWIMDAVQYVKEFRYVLNDYFAWPRVKSAQWKCKKCKKPAEWWCI